MMAQGHGTAICKLDVILYMFYVQMSQIILYTEWMLQVKKLY